MGRIDQMGGEVEGSQHVQARAPALARASHEVSVTAHVPSSSLFRQWQFWGFKSNTIYDHSLGRTHVHGVAIIFAFISGSAYMQNSIPVHSQWAWEQPRPGVDWGCAWGALREGGQPDCHAPASEPPILSTVVSLTLEDAGGWWDLQVYKRCHIVASLLQHPPLVCSITSWLLCGPAHAPQSMLLDTSLYLAHARLSLLPTLALDISHLQNSLSPVIHPSELHLFLTAPVSELPQSPCIWPSSSPGTFKLSRASESTVLHLEDLIQRSGVGPRNPHCQQALGWWWDRNQLVESSCFKCEAMGWLLAVSCDQDLCL